MTPDPAPRKEFGSLEPELRSGEFVFVDGDAAPSGGFELGEVEASVREPEGQSIVLRRDAADRMGLSYRFVAAWIVLGLESDLDLVGLTAAVSASLAEADISCNVIAGLRHDHVLVPLDRAREALDILLALR